MVPTGVDALLNKDPTTQLIQAVCIGRKALKSCPQLHLNQQRQDSRALQVTS